MLIQAGAVPAESGSATGRGTGVQGLAGTECTVPEKLLEQQEVAGPSHPYNLPPGHLAYEQLAVTETFFNPCVKKQDRGRDTCNLVITWDLEINILFVQCDCIFNFLSLLLLLALQ